METVKTISADRARGLAFLASLDLEYPPVQDFVLTNSGIVEPLPTNQDDWDEFKTNVAKKRDNHDS